MKLVPGAQMRRFSGVPVLFILLLTCATLCGCEGDLVPRDTRSLLSPGFRRSEIVGFVAGIGTTFAALPDLIVMLRRRSSLHMNPRMAAIMGVFQLFWVYYGLLILSRPVVAWNVIAVLTNLLSVAAYRHFSRKGRQTTEMTATVSYVLGNYVQDKSIWPAFREGSL